MSKVCITCLDRALRVTGQVHLTFPREEVEVLRELVKEEGGSRWAPLDRWVSLFNRLTRVLIPEEVTPTWLEPHELEGKVCLHCERSDCPWLLGGPCTYVTFKERAKLSCDHECD